MATTAVIHDLITPIREIIAFRSPDVATRLRQFIQEYRRYHAAHFTGEYPLDEAVEALSRPSWQQKVSRFDVELWRQASDEIYSASTSLLGRLPHPELILYPGFGSFNGRVYKFQKRPVIGCAPDFPRTTGINLKVLLAHEYGHFIRYHRTGVPGEISPMYRYIYEEGWATWFSIQLLPHIRRRQVFMSGLHKDIGMPDPPGGYLTWCRKNLKTLIDEILPHLTDDSPETAARFFQCGRLKDDTTPIRTGYYLGYKVIEMLTEQKKPRKLLDSRVSRPQVAAWLQCLRDRL